MMGGIFGVNMIGSKSRGEFPMAPESGSVRDPCEVCGKVVSWSTDDFSGEVSCSVCGYVVKEDIMQAPPVQSWEEEVTGWRGKKGKTELIPKEIIRSPQLRKTYSAGSTPGTRSTQTTKVKEIKDELHRMCRKHPDDLKYAKDLVDRVKRAQSKFELNRNDKRHSLIGVGKRPAQVNTFCVAAAILIRSKRDRAQTSREFGVGELLETVKKDYDDGDGLLLIGGTSYKATSSDHPGLGKSIVGRISQFSSSIDKILPRSYGRPRAADIDAAIKMKQMERVDELRRRCSEYYRLSISRGATSTGEFDSFHSWCQSASEHVDMEYSKCAVTRTKKVFCVVIAAEFTDFEAREVMRQKRITGEITKEVSKNALALVHSFRSIKGDKGEGGMSRS